MYRVQESDVLARNYSRSARRKGEDKWYRIIRAPNANAKGEHPIYCECLPCCMGIGKRGVADCGHLREFLKSRRADEVIRTEVATYVCMNKVDYENFKRAVPSLKAKPAVLERSEVKRNMGEVI